MINFDTTDWCFCRSSIHPHPPTLKFKENINSFIEKSESFINKIYFDKKILNFSINNYNFFTKYISKSYKLGIPNIPKWVYVIYLNKQFLEVRI